MEVISVVKTINHGGFGIVDEVICEDGKHYARKMFDPIPSYISDSTMLDKFRKRFIREVATQKLLPTEYFIPIYYEDLTSSKPWFIMPLAEEVYTNEIINCKNEGRLPTGLADILNSLEFLHSKSLIHRDLKPQNILKHDGIWKLSDFGLISQDKEILSQSITTSNHAYGTAMYCAPEQTTDFRRVTPQADIYSFGAILHDIFTDGKRVPYSELSGDGEIGFIIGKCTKHKKEHRFKDIPTLRNRLLYILSNHNAKTLTRDDAEWIDALKKVETWNVDKFESFIFYLKRNEDIWSSAFVELSSEIIDILFNLDSELFDEFALIYFDWVYKKSFNFDYCDVVVGYIHNIYQKVSDLEVKSKAVVSAAELGRSHNRWYVMKYVVKMANTDIDDNLAFRICLEIELAKRNKENFIRCVDGINLSINSFHSIIKNTLE